MKKLSVLLAAIVFSSPSIAGPFGLGMGQSLDELSKQMSLKKTKEFLFTASTAPRPHPDLQIYQLIVTPQHGLCKVGAVSRTFNTNVYGTAFLAKFDEIESALSEKYGKSDRQDFLRSGSIWNEPKDWMMGLRKQERVLNWIRHQPQPPG